jgi:hypothetical protein
LQLQADLIFVVLEAHPKVLLIVKLHSAKGGGASSVVELKTTIKKILVEH